MAVWHAAVAHERAQTDRAVTLAATELRNVFTAQVEARIRGLVRKARRWEQADTPVRRRVEWEADARRYFSDETGFQAIEWVDSSFHVRWIVPLEGNEAAQDLDLAFEERRRVALETARDRGEVIVTRTVELVQGGKGFLVYVPIFRGGQFGGFILGVFRVQKLLDTIFHENAAPGISIAVFDGAEDIYGRVDAENERLEAIWGSEAALDVHGVTWLMKVWPGRAFVAESQSALPDITLTVGLLMTVLLTLTTYLAQTAKMRAEELRLLNDSLEQRVAERTAVADQARAAADQARADLARHAAELARSNDELQGEITERKRVEDAIRAIVEGTSAVTGSDFFRSLVRHLAAALQVRYAFVAECTDATRTEVRTLAFWVGEDFGENVEYTLAGTPCEQVVGGSICYHPEGLQALFPKDQDLVALRAESYLGIALVDSSGRPLGHLAVLDDKPMSDDHRAQRVSIMQVFAARAGAELVRLRAEEAVARHAEQLARSNADLQQFASVASHDLQEPLRMVGSFTQLLARRYRGKLDAEADEFIHYIGDGVRRMQALINDLLIYSRLGTHGKRFEPTDTAALVDRVITDLGGMIQDTGVVVTQDVLPTVQADSSQLAQIFQNLISNAIKFHGDEPPRVHIAAERTDAQWRFCVRDNGIGIDPKYADRIFIIFQRLHGKAEYPGTGIGLTICKKIVERHGGRIWVVSQPGEGAAFYFTVPAAPGDDR